MKNSRILADIVPHKINYKGETFLGISTGIIGKSFSLTKIIAMKNNPGWIVRGDLVDEWKIKGFCTYENEIFLYGPCMEGKSLEEILDMDIHEFLPLFHRLISSFITLDEYLKRLNSQNYQKKASHLFRISTHSIFFLDDGGILFLPPDIMNELIDLRPFEDKTHFFSICNHPDRTGEKNLSFSLGVFLYRVLTGKYPYFSRNQEELHHMIRELTIPSPRITRPGLKDDVVKMINTSLDNSGLRIPSITAWLNSIQVWIDKGIEQELSEEEQANVKETEKQKKEKATSLFQIKIFLYKNFARIAIISGVILITGYIIGFSLYNIFLKPRITAGLSPREVVELYYDSINSLDYDTLSDCVIKNTGKNELQTVLNLFVLTRQIVPYGDSVKFISAKEWDRRGRPPLEPFTPMYGVVNVDIEQKQNEPEPVFVVSYEKWFTETEETDPEFTGGNVIYFGFAITERLFLKISKKGWAIYNIENLTRRTLSPVQ